MLSNEKGLERLGFVRDLTDENAEKALCRIPDTNLFVKMIRKNPKKSFLPASVLNKEEEEVWNFRQENFAGVSKLVQENVEGFCIALIRKGYIERALPVYLLPAKRISLPEEGETYAGINILENARLKIRIGKILRFEALLFPEEKRLLERAEKAREERKKEEKRVKKLAKEEKLTELLSRKKIAETTESGYAVKGIPCRDDGEWRCLKGGARVITVDDPENPKKKFRTFIVDKKPGGGTREKNSENLMGNIRPDSIRILIEQDRNQTVLFFNNGNLESAARSSAEGTLVASEFKKEEDKYKIFMVKEGELKDYGTFQLY